LVLAKLLQRGFAEGKDLNCAETILRGANEAYRLGLDREALKLAAGFGGGMAIESVCGALTGSIMVLSRLFVEDRAHQSPWLKELVQEFLVLYRQEMGSIQCDALKERYRTEEQKCREVIEKAASLLDKIIKVGEERYEKRAKALY
jgi:C_GCAxxG_C_C family probable redox protein